jgi:cell division protein ZapE
LGWLFSKKDTNHLPSGLYIHGKVGRGKSMLMDIFYDLAPDNKRRAHFNEFMADAHDRIHRQRSAYERGETKEADPIRPVGRELAREAKLLCFDEFAVTDIADAMILGRLFQVLFEKGVVVVATSNLVPDELYRDGLNRPLFEPFIDMLKHNCEIFELDAAEDFRLGSVDRGQAYLSPLNDTNREAMEKIWSKLAEGKSESSELLDIKGRKLTVGRVAGDAAWFSFGELCEEPRGARDFLAIANRFDTVFIENVPMMDYSKRNEAKRFILLIDTLYDNCIRTVISAAANPHALYSAGSGTEAFEFQRTASRLIEMQSESYQEKYLERREARYAS